MIQLVADGAFLFVGLRPASIRAALRYLAGFPVVFVVTLGLGSDTQAGARWVRSWFAPGQPFYAYPSAAHLGWLREGGFDIDKVHDPSTIPQDRANQIANAFGLFGSPERCAEQLLRARAAAGVCLFRAHDRADVYHMPEAEIEALERIIRPRIGG